jgi:hypothetical protein
MQMNAKPTPIWALGKGAVCTSIFQISDNRSRSYANFMFLMFLFFEFPFKCRFTPAFHLTQGEKMAMPVSILILFKLVDSRGKCQSSLL